MASRDRLKKLIWARNEGGPAFSEESLEVFGKMPNPLTETEKLCMGAFIDAEVLAGNWAKYDLFLHFALLDPVNARTSWVGTYTATEFGTPEHVPGAGYNFFGVTDYLDTGFDASTSPGSYALDDAMIGLANLGSNLGASPGMSLGGVLQGGNSIDIREAATGFQGGINGADATIFPPAPGDNEVLNMTRVNNTQKIFYRNGVGSAPTAAASAAIPTGNLFVGALNNGGVAQDFFIGSVANFYAASAVGFDHVVQEAHIVQLFNCFLQFSVTLRFPQPLEVFEDNAITFFVIREALVANWPKYDAFYCFPLTHIDNALWGWKDGLPATNVGATHLAGRGFEFDGVSQYIDSGFNPLLNGVNYTLNNGQMGAFHLAGAKGQDNYMFGNTNSRFQAQGASLNRLRAFLNNGAMTDSSEADFADESLYQILRTSVNAVAINKNGVEQASSNNTSTSVSDETVQIGRFGTGTAIDGILSAFQIGAAVGFNYTAHRDNVRILLNDLHVFSNQVLSRYTGLTTKESDAIIKFVEAEVDAQNWRHYDEFFAFGLAGANAFIGMKGKTATNNGAVMSIEGATFAGAQYIDTNFDPSVDGVNYQLEDCLIAVYQISAQDLSESLMGVNAGGARSAIGVAVAGNYTIGLNRTNAASVGASDITPNTLVTGARQTGSESIFQNGVSQGGFTTPATLLPTNSFFVGSQSNNGSPITSMNGVLSTAMIGARINFNHTANYNNQLEFLIDLGTFATPVLARYSALSQQEIDAITDFVNQEVRDGNWGKYDEVFCFALGSANALIGMKSKTATLSGDAAYEAAGQGIRTNTTNDSYINSNFTPSTDGVNYKADDASFSVTVTDFLPYFGGSRYFFGSIIDADGFTDIIKVDETRWNSSIQFSGISQQLFNHTRTREYNAASRLGTAMTSVTGKQKISATVGVVATPVLPTVPLYIGAANGASGSNRVIEGLYHAAHVGGNLDIVAQEVNMMEMLISLGVFANPVLARYSALSQVEEDAIRAFVNAEVRAGNWGLYDEFFCFSLNATDRLIGFKSKTAVNNGATFDINGAIFTGTQDIDTNFVPSVDGVNFKQDDARWGLFGKDNNAGTAIAGYMSAASGSVSRMQSTGVSDNQGLNSTGNTPMVLGRLNGLKAVKRVDSGNITAIDNGVQIDARVSASAALNTLSVLVANSLSTKGLNGWISTAIIGGGVGFDEALHNTNHRKLLTDLGVTLP